VTTTLFVKKALRFVNPAAFATTPAVHPAPAAQPVVVMIPVANTEISPAPKPNDLESLAGPRLAVTTPRVALHGTEERPAKSAGLVGGL